MRGAGIVVVQTLAATVGVALISGLIGFLIVHFAGWGDAVTGFGWVLIAGVLTFAGGVLLLISSYQLPARPAMIHGSG